LAQITWCRDLFTILSSVVAAHSYSADEGGVAERGTGRVGLGAGFGSQVVGRRYLGAGSIGADGFYDALLVPHLMGIALSRSWQRTLSVAYALGFPKVRPSRA